MIHFPSKAERDRYELSLLREENTRLSLETAKLRAKLGKCKDIVHGWDDPNDVSWWSPAFNKLSSCRYTIKQGKCAHINVPRID